MPSLGSGSGSGSDFNPLRDISNPKFSIASLKDALDKDRCNMEEFYRYLNSQTNEIPSDTLFGPSDLNVNNNRGISYESIIGTFPANYLANIINWGFGINPSDKRGALQFLDDMRLAGLIKDCGATDYSDAVLVEAIPDDEMLVVVNTPEDVETNFKFLKEGNVQESGNEGSMTLTPVENDNQTMGSTLYTFLEQGINKVLNPMACYFNLPSVFGLSSVFGSSTDKRGGGYNQRGGDPTPEQITAFVKNKGSPE
jgi:hypothetical protein